MHKHLHRPIMCTCAQAPMSWISFHSMGKGFTNKHLIFQLNLLKDCYFPWTDLLTDRPSPRCFIAGANKFFKKNSKNLPNVSADASADVPGRISCHFSS